MRSRLRKDQALTDLACNMCHIFIVFWSWFYLFMSEQTIKRKDNMGILLTPIDPADLLLSRFQDGCLIEDYVEEFLEFSH